MEERPKKIIFSVVIPTRNRPQLFKMALDSVLSQEFDSYEIIVVNDGSTKEFLEGYNSIKSKHGSDGKVRFYELIHRPLGHGQSYSMNYGVSMASGKYVCFLDDDDYWTDPQHLSRASKSILNSSKEVDVYYTNQSAYYSDGSRKEQDVWIEDLRDQISDKTADNQGSCLVDIPFLLKSKGFAHLNCTIIKKDLYQVIGGMDENIRYECDRDFYIRTIDNAAVIFYNPAVVSKHNIPDVKKKDNMSTLVSFAEKLIYQMRVYDKGISLSNNRLIIDHCTTGKMYILKKMAEGFYNQEKFKEGLIYSRQALGMRFTLKWLLFTSYLYFKCLTGMSK
ncbi:glycosyltransferase family 2 protein [Vibrio ziniensis]|uniref:Glycosyltransferase n=1 Tax=Vibrio ziniensis TaxID=2711221 RepID=A0A6G7CME2_9VIBR|nr:glycosyltransferase [Vibrio ziniensis]QIH43301.1 glycosyltransferase [Vibrio ziniensis]